MVYRVVVTSPAKRRLEQYIAYTAINLKNHMAAKRIIEDAKITKIRLSENADRMRLCSHPLLAKYGYRKIRFLKHDFVMLYRIVGNMAIVDGMFHELQDYEALFIDEMQL